MRKIGLIGYILLGMILPHLTGEAQVPGNLRKYVKVGMLHHFADAWLCEYGYNNSYMEGLIWPAVHAKQDNFVSARWWIGTRDFTDEANKDWSYFSLWIDRENENKSLFYPMEHKQIAKFQLPRIYVDGNEVSETTPEYSSIIDSIDNDQIPDRIVITRINTCIGLTIHRVVKVFSQQYHNNYFIYEITLENTGNTDQDDEIERPNTTLKDIRFGGLIHYATCRAGNYLFNTQQSWGIDQWMTKRGETYADWLVGKPGSDSLRCFFSWLGQDAMANYDNIGSPNDSLNGRLESPQHAGLVFIHADRNPNDTTDDPNQPSTVGWNGNDDFPQTIAYDEASMRETYEFLAGKMLNGNTNRMDSSMSTNPYPKSLLGDDLGGASGAAAWGPYTLAPGEKVKIVYAQGVSGLSRSLCESIGAQWKNETKPYLLPNGTTVDDKDLFKNQWVYTGQDSILQTFDRAVKNYQSHYNIPQPPLPPSVFNIISGGDRISLNWTDESQRDPDFGGYRIFRAVGKLDTTYEEIFACGAGTNNPIVVNQYDDTTPIRGYAYYYYITAFNRGTYNQTPANPGGELSSSLFYTRATEPAKLKRKAGSNLDSIRIVPNPYYIKAKTIQYPGEPNKIMFLNIPGQCTIRIFTERGDLIKTINHTNGSGDEEWDSVTSSRQIVVSGMYLVSFETPEGDKILKKMVIIR